MSVTMTIGQLRAAIAGFGTERDAFEVVVRVQDDDGQALVGGLTSLSFDAGCSDARALVLDGEEDAEPAQRPVCEHCNEQPATCIGNYEDHSAEDCPHEGCTQHAQALACDECCGHGCEDGSCEPIRAEVP